MTLIFTSIPAAFHISVMTVTDASSHAGEGLQAISSWMPLGKPASVSNCRALAMSCPTIGSLAYSGCTGATWWCSPIVPVPRKTMSITFC